MQYVSEPLNSMSNLSSLIALPLILLNMTNQTSANRIMVQMDFGNDCPTTFTRLDHHDEVDIRTDRSPDRPIPVEAGTVCSANFMTGYPDHGICFEANNMYFKSPGVKVSLWTTKDGPDVVFDRYHYKNFTEWCTDMRVVTLEVTVPDYVTDQNAEFRFSFSVKNKTKTDIAKIYNMDSYKECNLHHELQSGEAMLITGQRYPATQDLPQECWLTISTASGDEYEQVCLTLTYLVDQNCVSTLNVSGFQERWWDPVKSIGCHDDLPKESITTGEMCSKDKNLTFLLTRQSSDETGMTFKASIHSKWHTHWQTISTEKSELRGLSFVTGLTYFVAAIDSLAGIIAAVLATMIRHPRSFWKNWAESMSACGKSEAVHYEVNYPAVSCSQVVVEEGCSEAKAY